MVATGSPTLAYQWQKNHANIAGATSASYSTPATATSDSGETFDVIVSNSFGTVTSVSASLTVNALDRQHHRASGSSADVTTYHYDNLRTGENTHETTLTHANVNSSTFGLLGSIPVDGHVDAQPLYLSAVAISGQGTKNVLYVVTEHDSVYAFDADSVSGTSATTLWHSSMLAAGETSSDDRNCGQVTPEIGITSTPVIDRTRNAIYLVAVSKTSGGNYIHRFHALDLTTGSGTLRRTDHHHRDISRDQARTAPTETWSSIRGNTTSGRDFCKSAARFLRRGDRTATPGRTLRG